MPAKGSKLQKWTEDKFLIKFKYPKLDKYACYECPGAFYIKWIDVNWIKTGEVKKQRWVTTMELAMIEMAELTTKIYHKKFVDEFTKTSPLYDKMVNDGIDNK